MINKHTKIVKDTAKRLGFDFCGISKAEFLEEEAPRLENWLNQNHHGEMGYMANNFDKRLDPRKLVDGAKSVVSLLLNYTPEKEIEGKYKISKYAYGRDYHKTIPKKLKEFLFELKEQIGEINGRAFTDSAPVMDKVWAAKSGLGWQGKHSNLITRKNGSFFFIAELIIDLALIPDSPIGDFCGTCTKCIDACPTDAIIDPYKVDGSKCISYYTIELKNKIPEDVKGKFENWVFGCDICQDVCPWNRFSKPHNTPDFLPKNERLELSKTDFVEITEETFEKVFNGTPIRRTGYQGLIRNLNFVKDSSPNDKIP
tara:strand:- start:1728 stop:2666 length:939 start_codon:yes stop_codon:yes gene_type:complete